MATSGHPRASVHVSQRRTASARKLRRLALTGGGTDGNEQLTSIVGVILIILLAALGVTILRIHQLISEHLFLGLLLLGPVGLKLASTGYRFTRYYTHDDEYVRKGPPLLALRLIAPIVVISTLAVFASGVVLLFNGPAGRGQLLLIHKASFIVWLSVTAVHVLGHLPGLPASLRMARPGAGATATPGGTGRWIAMAGAIVGGLVIAIALTGHFGAWTSSSWGHHH
jgi:hypothetical protein